MANRPLASPFLAHLLRYVWVALLTILSVLGFQELLSARRNGPDGFLHHISDVLRRRSTNEDSRLSSLLGAHLYNVSSQISKLSESMALESHQVAKLEGLLRQQVQLSDAQESQLANLSSLYAKQIAKLEEYVAAQENQMAMADGKEGQVALLLAAQRNIQDQLRELKVRLAQDSVLSFKRPLKSQAQHPSTWRQNVFTHHGTHSFVLYSSYRMSASKVASVGMAGLRYRNHRQLQGCKWFGPSGAVTNGVLSVLYMEEHHSMQYEVVVLQCTLEVAATASGGHLEGKIDNEEILLFREEQGVLLEPPAVRPSKLTYCGSPMYGQISPASVREWFDYHRVVAGADHFVLYDAGGLDSSVVLAIRAYMEAGQVSVVDLKDAVSYDVWLYAQGVAIMDCLYRTRYSADWVFMMDIDEYLEALPPHTVPSLLSEHGDKAWLTHQVVWYDATRCDSRGTPPGSLWMVERQVYRDPNKYCFDNKFEDQDFCLSWWGHRKYFLNPRKVELVDIHKVLVPFQGGKDFNLSSELRHHHFRGIHAARNPKICLEETNASVADNYWVRDTSIADVIPAVKACAFPTTLCPVHQ